MPSAGASTHIVPVNALVQAAPQETLGLVTIHGEIHGSIRSLKSTCDGLGSEMFRRMFQLRQGKWPCGSVVRGRGHFKRGPFGDSSSATKKPDGSVVVPEQTRLVIIILKLEKHL